MNSEHQLLCHKLQINMQYIINHIQKYNYGGKTVTLQQMNIYLPKD